MRAGIAAWRTSPIALALAALLIAGVPVTRAQDARQGADHSADLLRDKNIDVSRAGAAQLPRSEGDQVLVDGWPLYRTERGQQAFNDAMATLRASDGAAPTPRAFQGCLHLECNLALPSVSSNGWIPPGRIWVSPTEYVLIVHSPRLHEGQPYRRRDSRQMRYFVFHEFHNSTRNTDPFDTISSHSGSVFVPLYMSKEWVDARGRRFVIVVQVAPYDVVSFHATDWGSAGPGMEVAKNMTEELEPLQGLAGIVVATILKRAAPQLEVVNHGGNEGLPMLRLYEHWLAKFKAHAPSPAVALPVVVARSERVAMAAGRLEDLIVRRGASPLIPIADRGVVPPKTALSATAPLSAQPALLAVGPEPALIGPIRPAVRRDPMALPRLVDPIRPATRPGSGAGG
ncbi:MAG: hypothetical protein J2P51_11310 [Hyphomicrobiaceae bacterium]|nr:hypothetical protein [Hyphomicrobiaceae bacterium]